MNHIQMLEKKEQQRLGINDDTLLSMKSFFLKTSVPRLIEERRKKAISSEQPTN